MITVYLLLCRGGALYVGSTRNLERRMNEHARGAIEGFTAERRPVRLLWFQEYDRIDEAYAMELKIKGWRRAKKLALADRRYGDLPGLSRTSKKQS